MWTEITRRKYEREGQRYASDLTDAEWAVIAPHMPAVKRLGRPRETELRSVVDAILYIARTGCQWRMLPKDFPPFTTVQGYFYDWRDNGLFEKINFELLRRRAKRRVVNPAHRRGSSTVNQSRQLRAVGRVVTMQPRRSKAVSAVCHEHIARVRRCGAMQEMREGPSRPAVGCRPQTAASCSRQERLW
jgi:transposase